MPWQIQVRCNAHRLTGPWCLSSCVLVLAAASAAPDCSQLTWASLEKAILCRNDTRHNTYHLLLQSFQAVGPWVTGLSCHQGLLQQCWQLHCNNLQPQQETHSDSDHQSWSSQDAADCAGGSAEHAWLPGSQQQWLEAWGLEDIAQVPAWLVGPQLCQLGPAAGWKQYYDLRQIPHSSPAGQRPVESLFCKLPCTIMRQQPTCGKIRLCASLVISILSYVQ
jgi:hypothetical protein